MEDLDSLTTDDAVSLLETIAKFTRCKSEEDLACAVRFSSGLLDFRWAAYSLALLRKSGFGPIPVKIANISFPDEWLQMYLGNCFHLIDPIYIENYKKFGLQVWKETYGKSRAISPFFMKKAEEFGLSNGYSIGAKNYRGTIGTLFSISGGSLQFNTREKWILKTLLPHIHEALLRVAAPVVREYPWQSKPFHTRLAELLCFPKSGTGDKEMGWLMNVPGY
jgi:hypothetical protein